MEFRLTLLVLTLGLPFLPVKGKIIQPPSCSQNMHYDKCGTSCPLHCENQEEHPVCNNDCNAGCFCDDGFVLLHSGSSICVERNQCPICTALGCDRQHREYKCGRACPITCANHKEKTPACTRLCVPGCFCKKNYLPNSSGDCVPVRDC
ncbi:inducible metalloproteinase inhibitor protein-like [Ascaphus truei]|uniref:inducible metalloproteinase inhibitor protein-like n=1 Tax=Ascaphus truei TaxID=8439 RepID=UPI003F59AEA7